MNIFLKMLFSFLILTYLINCDTKKNNLSNLDKQFACYSLAICDDKRGVKFGMIGDSWTDLVFGVNAIETLRVQLEKYHNYKIVGSTLGGTTLEGAYGRAAHIQVIDEAGPSLKYILVSLGGNDLQFQPGKYIQNGFDIEKANRLSLIKKTINELIISGNAHKINKWGGDPILWIFHGYDYPNPDNATNSTSCRDTLKQANFTDLDIDQNMTKLLDDFNSLLSSLVFEIPSFRYIDLRKTLGSSKSESQYMFDCIHPNSIGFRLLGDKYSSYIKAYTNNEK
jgi:lysophospholipase L1-like esterase